MHHLCTKKIFLAKAAKDAKKSPVGKRKHLFRVAEPMQAIVKLIWWVRELHSALEDVRLFEHAYLAVWAI